MKVTSDDLSRAMDIISWHCKSKAETWIPLANKIAQALAEERKRTLESEVVKGLADILKKSEGTLVEHHEMGFILEQAKKCFGICQICSEDLFVGIDKALAAYHAALVEKELEKEQKI